jgi:hypothetical protein
LKQVREFVLKVRQTLERCAADGRGRGERERRQHDHEHVVQTQDARRSDFVKQGVVSSHAPIIDRSRGSAQHPRLHLLIITICNIISQCFDKQIDV